MDRIVSPPTSPPALRRKRSSANAALTSRPSLLTLGRLVPSLQTCIMVHVRAGRLVHALFEPNFCIDATGNVVKLGRERWLRAREAVEALRLLPPSQGGTDTLFLHPPVGCATQPQDLVMLQAPQGVNRIAQALDSGDDLVSSLQAVSLDPQPDICNTILSLVQTRL